MRTTARGFALHNFKDANDIECTLQKSSSAMADKIWLGASDIGLKRFEPGIGWSNVELKSDPHGVHYVANNRMHLTQEQVRKLLPLLTKFAETGELA